MTREVVRRVMGQQSPLALRIACAVLLFFLQVFRVTQQFVMVLNFMISPVF